MRAFGVLPAKHVKGLSDPFVTVTVERTGQIVTTEVCHNTCDPRWYQSFYLEGTLLLAFVFALL